MNRKKLFFIGLLSLLCGEIAFGTEKPQTLQFFSRSVGDAMRFTHHTVLNITELPQAEQDQIVGQNLSAHIQYSESREIDKWLALATEKSINAKDYQGVTPLHHAVIKATMDPYHLDLVKKLIEKGANISAQVNGFTPLMTARLKIKEYKQNQKLITYLEGVEKQYDAKKSRQTKLRQNKGNRKKNNAHNKPALSAQELVQAQKASDKAMQEVLRSEPKPKSKTAGISGKGHTQSTSARPTVKPAIPADLNQRSAQTPQILVKPQNIRAKALDQEELKQQIAQQIEQQEKQALEYALELSRQDQAALSVTTITPASTMIANSPSISKEPGTRTKNKKIATLQSRSNEVTRPGTQQKHARLEVLEKLSHDEKQRTAKLLHDNEKQLQQLNPKAQEQAAINQQKAQEKEEQPQAIAPGLKASETQKMESDAQNIPVVAQQIENTNIPITFFTSLPAPLTTTHPLSSEELELQNKLRNNQVLFVDQQRHLNRGEDPVYEEGQAHRIQVMLNKFEAAKAQYIARELERARKKTIIIR